MKGTNAIRLYKLEVIYDFTLNLFLNKVFDKLLKQLNFVLIKLKSFITFEFDIIIPAFGLITIILHAVATSHSGLGVTLLNSVSKYIMLPFVQRILI